MGLVSLGAGVAIGYFLGTKTGKEKLDAGIGRAKQTAQHTWEREDVQDFVAKASDTATKVSHDVADSAKKAAAVASDSLKKAAEKADDAEEKVADVVDEAEDTVAEKASADWVNEGGAKP